MVYTDMVWYVKLLYNQNNIIYLILPHLWSWENDYVNKCFSIKAKKFKDDFGDMV